MNKERLIFSLIICMIILIYPIMFTIDHLSTGSDDEYVKLGFAVENNTLYNLKLVEKDIRRKVDIFHIFQKINEEPKLKTMQEALDDGYIVLLTLEPWSGRENYSARYSPSEIINGSIDRDIDRWAAALDTLDFKKGKLIIRTMHEINGNWYPWCAYAEGSSPELSKSAYMHVVDRLRAENNNLIFMSGIHFRGFRYDRQGGLEYLYNFCDVLPGDEYYDIVGISGYNRYSDNWKTFSELYDPVYANLTVCNAKPIWIAEISSVSGGKGDKAEWIKDMFYQVRHNYNIDAVVWFDENKWFQGGISDWAYDSTPESRVAFRTSVSKKNMRKI